MEETLSFSENLINIRKKKGITQSELAKRSGISARMLSYYEKKAIRPPIDKIQLLARVLNVSTTELIGNIQKKSLKKNPDSFESLENIDPRSLMHIKRILKLSTTNRFMVYKFAELLLKEQQELEEQAKSKSH